MKTSLPTTPCKGCGKPIVFAKLKSGKLIPLDTRTPVYRAFYNIRGDVVALPIEPDMFENLPTTETNAFVSHFATCSAANQFSKKGK